MTYVILNINFVLSKINGMTKGQEDNCKIRVTRKCQDSCVLKGESKYFGVKYRLDKEGT